MNKVEELLNIGWFVDFRKWADYFYINTTHNSWGNVDVYDKNLSVAITKLYDQAKELEPEN